MIDETALLLMRYSLIDYNKPNMDKHCSLSYVWCLIELFEGSSYRYHNEYATGRVPKTKVLSRPLITDNVNLNKTCRLFETIVYPCSNEVILNIKAMLPVQFLTRKYFYGLLSRTMLILTKYADYVKQ